MHFIKSTLLASIASLLLLVTTSVLADTTYPPLNKHQWTYDTDPYGSEAIINEKLIRHGGIWIQFKRVPRVDFKRNSWVELIHKLPNATLGGSQKILLTYQCDMPLIIKLSQQEYGKNGDKSYAHYQIKLPASQGWTTKEIALQDFARPK